MKPKNVISLSLCLMILCLAGCSDTVYRDRMVSGFELGPIRSGEWVQTKKVNGVLVRREHRKGFELGALYFGHTTVNYSRNKIAASEAQSEGAKP